MKPRIIASLVLLAVGCLHVRPADAAELSNARAALRLFVATNGNDRWTGSFPAPNSDRTDGPLASLTGARDAIRKLRSAPSAKPVTVFVRAGTYRLGTPFVLEPQDSGTAEAPVVYAGFEGERPVLSGGGMVSGWRQYGQLWEATFPDTKGGRWIFRQLFAEGQRRQRARSPNAGYFRVAKLLPGPMDAASKQPVLRDQFGFRAGDLASYARLRDVNEVLMHSWETSIHPLKAVDPVSNIVQFIAPLKEWWSIGYWEKAQRYYVENALELLDQPGEWYLNRDTWVLSYWPLPGEEPGKTELIAPRLGELVRIEGDPDRGRLVEYVTLRGLRFQHADWDLDPQGNSSTQAAVEVPAAITANGALHCVIENCEV
jgi:hypothetical protein